MALNTAILHSSMSQLKANGLG